MTIASAESLFKQLEMNESSPVYAAFDRKEYKSDAARCIGNR